mmetsp:Transcript_17289/g.39835  ORF Transcript_17289/g.39835 Transcript_17289/m.39835 type:complete len:258 (+) Transcript_17289:1141-1914(+)
MRISSEFAKAHARREGVVINAGDLQQALSVTRFRAGRPKKGDLVLVLLEGGLVLEVGLPRAEAPRLRVEVERAVDPPLGVGQLLQRLDEGGQHRVDRPHAAQGVERLARGPARRPAAEEPVGGPGLGVLARGGVPRVGPRVRQGVGRGGRAGEAAEHVGGARGEARRRVLERLHPQRLDRHLPVPPRPAPPFHPGELGLVLLAQRRHRWVHIAAQRVAQRVGQRRIAAAGTDDDRGGDRGGCCSCWGGGGPRGRHSH